MTVKVKQRIFTTTIYIENEAEFGLIVRVGSNRTGYWKVKYLKIEKIVIFVCYFTEMLYICGVIRKTCVFYLYFLLKF
jgi:hypothetical protein